MVASQFLRLQQTDPTLWLAWDYVGRLGALAVLASIPAARAVAFQRTRLGIVWWEVVLWTAVIVLADRYVLDSLRGVINAALPGTRLGSYPETAGWLHWIDIIFGIALVAVSEEIVFRRCARHVVEGWLGNGIAMVVATSLLFGAYHWWTGIGNVIVTALIGGLLMMFYQRSKALWPVVLAHYLTDVAYFA